VDDVAMHIHILGICGTFMGGIAALARAAGHTVTGSDSGVYPPMSDQLRALGIDLIDGFDPAQLDAVAPDLVVVGNVMSRGMPIVERLLERRMPYASGPEWLARHVLHDREVIAVSGTHGKTTTASMTAWLLEQAGLRPGFLIGGVPANFGMTARLGEGRWFVIEADEYDTAFFDKRAKFLHYGPATLIINNLEFDHADIYADMAAIRWQFHQLLRILPGNGRLIANSGEEIDRLLAMGCWTPVERYSSQDDVPAEVRVRREGNELQLTLDGAEPLSGSLVLPGMHNAENAAAAVLAACEAGISPADAMVGLAGFRGVRRRLELRGVHHGVRVYDDFAHHPTAIRRTLEAVRETAGGRVIAVLEPRSNSMKMGAHRDQLPAALTCADRVWVLQPAEVQWQLDAVLGAVPGCTLARDIDTIVAAVVDMAEPGDDIVVMSNGGFGGIHERLCAALEAADSH
jgi:UDP-N-acetylmuramate: L-alanyl-gamma-D-glutamyl-meso-diaminopimelate ligase